MKVERWSDQAGHIVLVGPWWSFEFPMHQASSPLTATGHPDRPNWFLAAEKMLSHAGA
jgi:hypothetical protein